MSGIAFLRRLLMKQAMKKSASSSGIMSLNKNLVNDVDNTVKKWVDSAKSQGQDIDKMGEQELKYLIELNKPKPITPISADSSEGKIITQGLNDMLGKASGENVIKTDFGGGITDIVTETITKIKTLKPIDAMKEANSVIGRKGKYKNLTEEQSKKILKDTNDHIFERDIKYDEFGEIIKPDPEDFAHGGRSGSGLNYLLGEDDQNSRVPFGGGKFVFDAARRKFLQTVGGAAAGIGAAKSGLFGLLKGGGKKQVVETLTSVPIKDISGMPAWFKPLVNKVIKEGGDVSKRFATGERQIVHQSTLPDSKTNVLVTQNLDTGDVLVDVGMGKHGFKEGHLGQPVRLEYKASELIEPPIIKEGKVAGHGKGTKTKEEFWVEEAEFTGGHPENVKFEDSTFEKFGEHGSDFSEVEKFATGTVKKKTAKESLKAERSHWVPEGDDMASGGRVPLSGGGGSDKLEEAIRAYRKYQGSRKNPRLNFKTFFKVYAKENFASGGRASLSNGGIAGMLGE